MSFLFGLKTAVDFRASLRFPRACLGQAASSSRISYDHHEGKKRPHAAPVLFLSELIEPLSLFVAPGASSASPVGVSRSPLLPQDKEGLRQRYIARRKCDSIFEESQTCAEINGYKIEKNNINFHIEIFYL